MTLPDTLAAKVAIDNAAKLFTTASGGGVAVEALGPISADIAKGEFVAFVGPSGCGKSTLLRLIAGLDQPSTGTVSVDGAAVLGPDPSRGMVFQQFALFPWLKLRDNIGFALKDRKGKNRLGEIARRARVERLMDDVGLTGFADHYPATLSGGMQQRAALARALAPDPEILLLDEPFGALDQQTRGLMQELLATLWAEHAKTVILVTHDIEEAIFLADRVFVMTARPGRTKLEIAVDLPRPRSHEVRTEARFIELKREISESLRSEITRLTSQ